jgi:dephospho-CoA kinase
VVTRLLRTYGAVTFSADEAARAILTPGGSVLREIVATFGPGVLAADGSLNRAELGRIVFADPDARARLDALTHPAIRRLLEAQVAAAAEDLPGKLAVIEVPLLYEKGLESRYDQIVVVTASESVQEARLQARDGLSQEDIRRRLSAQWPVREKAARADFVVENSNGPEALEAAVAELWRQLAVMRSGADAGRGDTS